MSAIKNLRSGLIVAASMCRAFPDGRCIIRIAGAMWQILFFGLIQRRRVSPDHYSRRMADCRACRMFNSRLGTCGTPGETYVDADGQKQTLGCWCIQNMKARLPDATCWARDHNLGFGWKD